MRLPAQSGLFIVAGLRLALPDNPVRGAAVCPES
jgi:hypothetical protein